MNKKLKNKLFRVPAQIWRLLPSAPNCKILPCACDSFLVPDQLFVLNPHPRFALASIPNERCCSHVVSTSQVAWNAKIGVFLRDFDSLEIRAGASVAGQLYVRRFEASHMAVLPIVVGKGADVRTGSVVYGGTNIGQNW